ncbi:MAG: ABC transporter substrate-binding protein [Clostridia bacterium]|nr:ABC transporter substrate-binding protein [Clostridia bacterium]
MKLHRRILSALLAVLMLSALALTGCGSSKSAGQVVIGNSTEANGDWTHAVFGSNNATDADVVQLTDDCFTVQSNQHGDYVFNKSVVDKHERTEDADGNVTYTITIKKDLVFNNGDPITAENFLAWTLFTLSKAGADIGTAVTGYNVIPGGNTYRTGETNTLPGLRLLDPYTFSVTILKTGYDGNTYLPYYFDITYASMHAVNLDYWFGPGWHVKDDNDGNGAYLVNDNGLELTMENTADYFNAAAFATSDRVTAGPYNLVSFDKSANQITLEVNPNYCGNFEGQKPGIEKIIIVKTDDETVVDTIATGGIQIYSGFGDGDQINAIYDLMDKGTIDSSFCTYDRAGYGYFGFSCDLGPAQYKEFRQAVAHLLDRNEFANTYCQGYGTVVHGPYGSAFTMTKDSKKEIAALDTYDYSVEDAVALLKQAGFVYNEDGSDYVDGSGKLRYKKVSAAEAQNYESFCKTVGGDTLMPALLNWASSTDNPISDLLVTMLANGEGTKQAGVEIRQNLMSFPELINYLYRQDLYGLGGDYAVPTYNMFNLATNFPAAYDLSFEFTTNEEYLAEGYNTTHCYDEELDRLSMDMVYGVDGGDYATYLDYWQKFVTRYNELLPQVPLYSNVYHTVYPNTIKNYQEDSFWGYSQAILYAKYIGD